MITILQQNALLVLFFVAVLGYAIGQIRIFGIQLGVAAVLFAGLFVGALDSSLTLPSFVTELGLVVFLYAIGLSNGVNFFRALRHKGNLLFLLFSLTLPLLFMAGFFLLFDLSPGELAGIYAGSETATPALAGVLDVINSTVAQTAVDPLIAAVVVGYAISYPIGVMGRMIPIAIMERLWRIDYAAEAEALRDVYPIGQEIEFASIAITNTAVTAIPLRDLQQQHNWDIVFGRIRRGDTTELSSGDTQFQLGDIVAVAGKGDRITAVTHELGETAVEDILLDRSVYTSRRVFVSNPDVVGQPLAALDLKEKYGALVSHVRRGDSDILASSDTILELGDRVRILARRSHIDELTQLFGDSYTAVSRVNLLSFGLGVLMGLLLGLVTLALPGGIAFRLGFAGGPLIVALLLGALRRTGPIVWTLPYSTNQTLQQMGLILLLAGVGVRSGNTLLNNDIGNSAALIALAAAILVLGNTFISLIIGYKVARIPFSLLAGMVAFQPAVLSFVLDRSDSQLPQIGYATAFPIGVILKVAYAQVLFLLLSQLQA